LGGESGRNRSRGTKGAKEKSGKEDKGDLFDVLQLEGRGSAGRDRSLDSLREHQSTAEIGFTDW